MRALKKSASWASPKWVKSNEPKEEERETKASVNNGQLHLQPPPQVAHASCLDQHVVTMDANMFYIHLGVPHFKKVQQSLWPPTQGWVYT